jgi:C4-dicarboxylate transporter
LRRKRIPGAAAIPDGARAEETQESQMNVSKLIPSLVVAASLLVGVEPVAMALPAAPQPAVGASADQLIVKTVTRAGVAHRSARRTSRRVVRRH